MFRREIEIWSRATLARDQVQILDSVEHLPLATTRQIENATPHRADSHVQRA